jgi:hypothetical protein
MYFWAKNAFSKDGVFDTLEPDNTIFIITLLPFFNTLASIMFTSVSLTGKERYTKRKPINLSKFFNVKK